MGCQSNQRKCRRNDLLKPARRCFSYADQRISLRYVIVQPIVMGGFLLPCRRCRCAACCRRAASCLRPCPQPFIPASSLYVTKTYAAGCELSPCSLQQCG